MGALHRRESRGAHIREDHPKRNDERYLKRSLIKLGADSQYELTERDVVFTKYEPQEGGTKMRQITYHIHRYQQGRAFCTDFQIRLRT